jgi:AcrR family transcriptional regulator
MATAKAKKTAAQSKNADEDISWQAQKSAMTRERILDGTIKSFINLGYTNVTTAKVASTAKVSRGAMLHHFPSKNELIRAAVEYLHDKLLQDYTDKVGEIPKKLKGKERRRGGLDAYWAHITGDLYAAYHELCVAGRNDKELKDILKASTLEFKKHVDESNAILFKEWVERGDRYEMAMDVTELMMTGMAIGQLVSDRGDRITVLLDYLADRLEEIFLDGEPTSAIGRHSAK